MPSILMHWCCELHKKWISKCGKILTVWGVSMESFKSAEITLKYPSFLSFLQTVTGKCEGNAN